MLTSSIKRYSAFLLGLLVFSNVLADDKPIRSYDIDNQSNIAGFKDDKGIYYKSTCPDKGHGVAYVSECRSAGAVLIPSVVDFEVYQQPGYPIDQEGWFVDSRTRNPDDDPNHYKHYTSDVKCIGRGAFAGNKDVVSVELPNSITTVETGSFASCKNLSSVKFGWKVKWVEDKIFSGCEKLKFVDLGESLTSITLDMFLSCKSLESIEIPNSVETIETESFSGCSSLKDIKIPNSVVEIESTAFMNCTNLSKIRIPSSVSKLGAAFIGCSSLVDVNIPKAVTSIKNETFEGCSSLPLIVIHKNIERIGEKAFAGCLMLMDVHSEIEEPFDIPENTFEEYTYENAVLHVPQGTKRKYMKCRGWQKFKNIHQPGEYDMTQLIVMLNVSDGGKVVFRETEVRNQKEEFDILTFFGRDLMFNIIPDEGYHIKSVVRNKVDVTDKLENEEGVIKYIQYEALTGMTLDVSFEKDSQVNSQNVFTARTPQGIDMIFEVLDINQKLVQVGVGSQGQPAIVSSIDDLVIPAEINGYKVVAIGEYAFEGCTNLRSVSIPWTAGFNLQLDEPNSGSFYSMWVRDNAFRGCNNITTVIFSANIEPGISDMDYPLHWIFDNVFDEIVFQTATLYVPHGYKSLFQSREKWAWCEFLNVVEHSGEVPYNNDEPNNIDGSLVEYFIDKDPGYGKASVLKIKNEKDEMELDLGSTQPGAHVLYVRSRDEQGRWSPTVSHPLYVRNKSIEAMEYFFDSYDPGKGNATPVLMPQKKDDSFTFEVELSNLTIGDHQLNIRFKDTNGLWSTLVTERFSLITNTNIDKVEAERFPSIIYTLKGSRSNGQRGLNIIRYKDGTTKKVIMK